MVFYATITRRNEKHAYANARSGQHEHVALLGKRALFTDSRIAKSTIAENFFCYDLRGSDYDPGRPVTVWKH